ncbi:MAG: hypothetical protein OXR72_14615 [Gemmatimonadota bacterium]|nr:hypothetical protein [Gemmatimonadota bacterium]
MIPRSAANIVSINHDCKIATRAIGISGHHYRLWRRGCTGAQSRNRHRKRHRGTIAGLFQNPVSWQTAHVRRVCHHFDEAARLPREFEIVAENAPTLQAVVSKDRRITCTQYHPELPYDYIGKLMQHWAPNYTSMFAEDDFRNLLARLKKKEKEEESFRKIEFRNWLEFVRKGG